MFQRFLSLCAGTIGQFFNASRIGNDCGLNHGTVNNWLAVLEASYITFRLAPHLNNYRKRLVKTPKLYFYDVGMAIRLLGIETPAQLSTHPPRGPLFENWVIVELLKSRYNQGKRSNLFFWRNNTGLEVDVIAEQAGKLIPIEIKSGATFASDWVQALRKWLEIAEEDAVTPALVYGGDQTWEAKPVTVYGWQYLDQLARCI